jgi:hypothetical protein
MKLTSEMNQILDVLLANSEQARQTFMIYLNQCADVLGVEKKECHFDMATRSFVAKEVKKPLQEVK